MKIFEIEYTNKMKAIDELWSKDKENFKSMAKLQKLICDKAKKDYPDLYFKQYIDNIESVVEVYKNKDEFDKFQDKEPENNCAGNCKALINIINETINR